ncbi:MAG TPA: type II secretion system protein [Gemmatimonadaceae bacterium]|nr:type II secretion system protein [Gemmatimonadaceae bacterium]
MRARRGFSISELLVVLTILGIVTRIALPRYNHLRVQAEARAVVGDVLAVRVAALNYFTDRQTWPGDVGAGVVPPELVPLLPANFPFQRPQYTMDWEVWPGAGVGGTGSPNTPVIALTIDTPNPNLSKAIRAAAKLGLPYMTSGSQTTFLITGFGGT